MIKIYKYQFAIDSAFEIRMPSAARILHVNEQVGIPCIWAEVDVNSYQFEMRKFHIFGTGHDTGMLQNGVLKHVGTFMQHEGALVWHLYEDTLQTMSCD